MVGTAARGEVLHPAATPGRRRPWTVARPPAEQRSDPTDHRGRPAGWGKTTLLSEWARDPCKHRRVAWVSLDESDDEPRYTVPPAVGAFEIGVGDGIDGTADGQEIRARQ